MECNKLQLFFRLVYDDKSTYAEYDVDKFMGCLLEEWDKLKGAGDRKEVVKRAFERACEVFKLNAVSFKV